MKDRQLRPSSEKPVQTRSNGYPTGPCPQRISQIKHADIDRGRHCQFPHGGALHNQFLNR